MTPRCNVYAEQTNQQSIFRNMTGLLLRLSNFRGNQTLMLFWAVWFTHIVTLGGYLHRSHREQLALPREAYSPSAWWSTMYVTRRGHDVSNPYTGRSQWGSSPIPTLARPP